MPYESASFGWLPDLARGLHEEGCDLALVTVSNEIAGAPEIPAPGLHYFILGNRHKPVAPPLPPIARAPAKPQKLAG
jgi:hypothetical protein